MVPVTHPFPSCAGNLRALHHLDEEKESHTWAHTAPSHSQGAPDTTDFATCILDAAHLSTIKLFNQEKLISSSEGTRLWHLLTTWFVCLCFVVQPRWGFGSFSLHDYSSIFLQINLFQCLFFFPFLEKFSASKQTWCVGKGVMKSEFSQLILTVSKKCLNFCTILIQICILFWLGLAKQIPPIPGQVVSLKKEKRSSYFFPFLTNHANPILLTISLKYIFSLPIYYSLPE